MRKLNFETHIRDRQADNIIPENGLTLLTNLVIHSAMPCLCVSCREWSTSVTSDLANNNSTHNLNPRKTRSNPRAVAKLNQSFTKLFMYALANKLSNTCSPIIRQLEQKSHCRWRKKASKPTQLDIFDINQKSRDRNPTPVPCQEQLMFNPCKWLE